MTAKTCLCFGSSLDYTPTSRFCPAEQNLVPWEDLTGLRKPVRSIILSALLRLLINTTVRVAREASAASPSHGINRSNLLTGTTYNSPASKRRRNSAGGNTS